jgi:uncharacterized protein YqjF (DUF2071 family)
MREADTAKQRLLAVPGDPLVHVEWHRVLFLNYLIDPKIVRPHIPPAFELDLYGGQACISLVRVIMRNYRRAPNAPGWGAIFGALAEQRFLNFRAYVRHRDEPGAFFMWGWLSRPLGLPLPNSPTGLTCAFANFCEGRITGNTSAFTYEFNATDRHESPCLPGSINEFALERYSGFFAHRGTNYVFRAWHDPWLVAPAQAEVTEVSLITHRFSWFANATFADSAYAPLSDPVWLGRAHRLPEDHHHRARAFLEFP